MPPRYSCSSKIVTAWPIFASWYAQERPAGPPPITATFLPVGAGAAGNARLLAIAYSPRKCSTELMPTWSSTSLRLQPVSHGAGHTRPITEGNGFASVSRRHAYSCQLIFGLPSAPSGGFSMPRTMLR